MMEKQGEKRRARLLLCVLSAYGHEAPRLVSRRAAQRLLFGRLAERHGVELVEDDPDAVLIAGLSSPPLLERAVARLRRRFGAGPAVGYACYEFHVKKREQVRADFCLSMRPPAANNFPMFLHPFGAHIDIARKPSRLDDLYRALCERAGEQRVPGEKFCNFIYTNAGAGERIDFCRRLSRYKRVDCPSFVLHNMRAPGFGALQEVVPPRDRHARQLDFMRDYKFTIAFENCARDWYVSEKIWNALLAGTVPIYWGCRQITELVNPACFVNCRDYPDFDAVVARVKEIDQDPALYESYLRAPVFLPDSKAQASNLDAAAAFLAGVARRAQARRPFPAPSLRDRCAANAARVPDALWHARAMLRYEFKRTLMTHFPRVYRSFARRARRWERAAARQRE